MNKAINRLLAACAIALASVGQASAVNCVNAASDPDGDGWGWENGQSCSVVFKGFRVSGSVLKDANGNAFVARGVNNPHVWYDAQSYNVLGNLAGRKTNLIRVVWTTGGSASRLDQILTAIEAQKMVPMVELHDGTGSNNASLLQSMANYWTRTDILAILKKHERFLLLNIANEWGDSSKTPQQWSNDYKQPITTIRNAGLTTTIVIDNPGYGQNGAAGVQYGAGLVSHDPRHNLLFSIHAYGMYNNANDIYSAISAYKNSNLALVFGEFGYNYNNGANNLNSKVDALKLMEWSQQFGVGYVAWSTTGNDSANAWLDLMKSDWTTTTSWGNTVWYSQYGISNTAVKASVFN